MVLIALHVFILVFVVAPMIIRRESGKKFSKCETARGRDNLGGMWNFSSLLQIFFVSAYYVTNVVKIYLENSWPQSFSPRMMRRRAPIAVFSPSSVFSSPSGCLGLITTILINLFFFQR